MCSIHHFLWLGLTVRLYGWSTEVIASDSRFPLSFVVAFGFTCVFVVCVRLKVPVLLVLVLVLVVAVALSMVLRRWMLLVVMLLVFFVLPPPPLWILILPTRKGFRKDLNFIFLEPASIWFIIFRTSCIRHRRRRKHTSSAIAIATCTATMSMISGVVRRRTK